MIDLDKLGQRLDAAATSLRDLGGEEEYNHADDIDAARRYLQVLARIHAVMDGEEWNSDTTGYIGDILTGAGFTIAPPGAYDEEE